MHLSSSRLALSLTLAALLAMGCGADRDPMGDPSAGDGDAFGDGDGGGDAFGDGDGDDGVDSDGDGKTDDDDWQTDGKPAEADPNAPADPGVPPAFTPMFPGAGTSGDDEPLTNGELCDYVPIDGAPTPEEITTCFFSGDDPNPAATMEQVLECVDGSDVVHIRLTFNPTFADNTYGANAIGWTREEKAAANMADPDMKKRGPNGHSFEDLVGSDHAEIVLTDGEGNPAVQFKLDYISENGDADSGYSSLGVTDGEGEMILGDAAWVLDYNTSISRNFNERGYGEYTVDSPATDADFSPNADAPEWDFRVVYEAWIDVAAFGDAGFGTALIEFVHASPSKAESNTLEVMPDDCPPELCADPDGCYTGPPCGDEPDEMCVPDDTDDDEEPPPDDEEPPPECDPSQPDADCGTGNPPDDGDPIDCDETPELPECMVD